MPRPRAPAVVAAAREVEVAVVPAVAAVLLVELPGTAHRRGRLADHGRVVAAHIGRAVDPDPRVVLRQQRRVHVRVVPLPPAQLRRTPHAVAVHAAELLQPGQDRAVVVGARRVQEARQRAGEAEAVGVEGGQRHRAVAALGGADGGVATGREALVGGQPIGQLAGQERVPLLAAVLLPVGVHAPRAAGRGHHRDALAAQRVHRVAGGDPVAHVGRRVEGVQQVHRVRAAGEEGHRDVPAHGRRRNHQAFVARGPGLADGPDRR